VKIGILVNTNENLPDIIGLTRAALSKGHEVNIFTMDMGTKLLKETSFTDLCKLEGVQISFCDVSAKRANANTDGLCEKIVRGSQLNNAIMNHNSDKVIVL